MTLNLLEKYNESREKIQDYLKTGISRGSKFFKAKHIAKDLDLSSKEVGTNLAILSEVSDELEISRWSHSNSTTWMVKYRNKKPTTV
ncbi:MAG TPA: hypothetical protein O0X32_00205 [Methanocorpusculum sp.]|nr:hypothetical protein [Methanocorpusculum sp.]